MNLSVDRMVALCLLAFSVGYGVLAWNHPLLPFEARMPFKPNTLPLGLAVLGVVFSILTLVFESQDQVSEDGRGWRTFQWKTTAVLVAFMIAYALLLRPLGYIGSTSLFLIASAILLGETRWMRLVPIAVVMSLATWYIVQEGLGIYLVPLPAFMGAL